MTGSSPVLPPESTTDACVRTNRDLDSLVVVTYTIYNGTIERKVDDGMSDSTVMVAWGHVKYGSWHYMNAERRTACGRTGIPWVSVTDRRPPLPLCMFCQRHKEWTLADPDVSKREDAKHG